MRKRAIAFLLTLPLALCALTGCQRHSYSETYYLIANNMALPYWQTAVAGFNRAARAYGVKAVVAGPNTFDAQAELEAFQSAVRSKPNGILISVADPMVLQPAINSATDTARARPRRELPRWTNSPYSQAASATMTRNTPSHQDRSP